MICVNCCGVLCGCVCFISSFVWLCVLYRASTMNSLGFCIHGPFRLTRPLSIALSLSTPFCTHTSHKQQAQLYYANKSRYIGVFETREKASLAYEIAREILDKNKKPARSGTGVSLASEHTPMTEDETKRNFALAQKASYEGVTEIVARNPSLGNNFGKSSEELRKEYTDMLKTNEL